MKTKSNPFRRVFKAVLVSGLCLILIGFLAGNQLRALPAHAGFGIGGVLKGAAIAVAVDKFGGQLNKFLNTAMQNEKVPMGTATKVVPIISLGSGGYVGAAQVTGTKSKVEIVEAVVQIEASFEGRLFRAKILVPVESESLDNINRVEGVGVSAVIDVKV